MTTTYLQPNEKAFSNYIVMQWRSFAESIEVTALVK